MTDSTIFHIIPHDMNNIEFGTGMTKYEQAEELFRGTRLNTIQKIGFADGVNAVRSIFPSLHIDRVSCRQGLDALRNYHREYNEKLQEYKTTAVHDWSSDPSDAFRYMATGITMPKSRSFKSEYMKKAFKLKTNKNWMTA